MPYEFKWFEERSPDAKGLSFDSSETGIDVVTDTGTKEVFEVEVSDFFFRGEIYVEEAIAVVEYIDFSC